MKTWLQEHKRFIGICILMAVIHMGLVFAYGMQKEGFHEDELFSFTTSSGIKYFTPKESYIWKTGYQIQQEFMVVEGEEFSFSEVIQNQAEDVHPPLFYLALNIVMSLMSNHFYKWFGIGINLVFSLITYVAVLFFFYRLDRSRQNTTYALIAGAVYAISPVTISNIMLVRMYVLSSMWTMLYACLFLLLMQNFHCSKKRFAGYIVSGAIICYLAFLTHYFSLLLPFFFTLGYCIYTLLQRKNILRMLLYGVTMVAAIGLAILTYPASWNHIFHGYRGEGVFDSLSSPELFGTTKNFLGILNEYMFANMLLVCVMITLVALVIGLVRVLQKKATLTVDAKKMLYSLAVCLIGCVITTYFLTRSALLVGEASCRFFYPVMVLFLPLMAYCVCKGFYGLIKDGLGEKTKLTQYALPVLALVVMIPAMAGFVKGDVLFLYAESGEKKAIIQEYQQYPAIMVFDSNAPYRSWYVADQLWMFSQVFYLDSQHFQADFQDATIQSAEKLVVYVDAPPEYLEKLKTMNPMLENISLLWHDDFFYVYALE